MHGACCRCCGESVAGLHSLWPFQRKPHAHHRLMLLQGGPEKFTAMHEDFMHLFLPQGGILKIR